MPKPRYRYPWPASAIDAEDMALLHGVREASRPRVPISALVAGAVRACYGQALRPKTKARNQPPKERKEAA